jgi:hypothetical protein
MVDVHLLHAVRHLQGNPVIDTRVVYGARCSWWDSIDKAVRIPGSGIPRCPHCHGVLYEMSAADWATSVRRYVSVQPDYVEFIAWCRGRCMPSFHEALATYRK